VIEPTMSFFVNLSNANGALLADSTAVGTIQDNDSPAVITIDDVVVNETDGSLTFQVTLSHDSDLPLTVQYATANGGTGNGWATAGSDYTAASGTLTFEPGSPGQVSQSIVVSLINDPLEEPDEQFFVNLSQPSTNGSLGDATATGTIRASDPPPTISIGDVTAAEGTGRAQFTVLLSHASESTITVHFATANGTALAGIDMWRRAARSHSLLESYPR